MNSNRTQPDEVVDRILAALREAPAPTGMNQRIAARLAQATQAPAAKPSLFDVILSSAKDPRILSAQVPLYTMATIALLAITIIAVYRQQRSQTIAGSDARTFATFHHATPEHATPEHATPKPRAGGPPYTSVGRSPTYTHQTITRGPEARPITQPTTSPLIDPDAIALAETLAPTQPAPTMPLTAEEHLLVTATRQGQPIELAELDILRQPALQAASEVREHTAIRNYIQSLLRPLAAAEALNPTSPSPSLSGPPSSR